MCGIHIYHKDFDHSCSVDHRGIESSQIEWGDYVFKHVSLPLQSWSTKSSEYIQPIKITNDLYLLYNGEIFNFRKFGIYKSDLEYLKKFFENGFNEKLLIEMNRWDGFWSIVLLDKNKNECIMFTDPLGKKQLYYSHKGICSEIRPLIMNEWTLEYNEKCFGTSNTPFFGVHRILPNVIYKWDIRFPMPYVYLRDYFRLKGGTLKNDIFEMMEESVKLRTINKMDSVTLFLSGGLDSSIIMFHLLNRMINVEYLTIENGEDETYIKLLEARFGIKVKRIKLNKKLLSNAIHSYEHPIDYGSLLPQYCLTKAASNRVILTGDGADELFGGYSRAMREDTYMYDVMMELPYYHHIRLDRVGMAFTKEIRSPFLSTDLIRYTMNLPYHIRLGEEDDRVQKTLLKKTYQKHLPKEIVNRVKEPLRMNGIKDNGIKELFYGEKRPRSQIRKK